MIKFRTISMFGAFEHTARIEIDNQGDFNKHMKVAMTHKHAWLNDVQLVKDGNLIMNVRNHVPELLDYLNGGADEFTHRSD